MSPSVAIIHDPRITAVHATVSPICESPLRLCDQQAWSELNDFNKYRAVKRDHVFLKGTYGRIYNTKALQAGHSWKELQDLAEKVSPYIFVSQNWEQLEKRNTKVYFHPGTHDVVCFDLAYLGGNCPQIPIYSKVNSGHGGKARLSVSVM